jgi:hypothetical protein
MLQPTRAALCVRSRMLLGFFVLSMTLQVSLRAQSALPGNHPKALSESERRVLFDSEAFFGPSAAMPQWDNGYLVSRAVETFEAGEPNVRLYDQSGGQVREAAIWFPGSQRVVIYSATATSDGRIIAAGFADKLDGAVGPFIALTDLAGKMTDIIQTNGFAPANICQAPDGTIWSFGGTGYDERYEHSEPKPGNTLRHFDFQKGEVGSYLPRSTFPKHPGPEMGAYIRCSAGEVVAYSPRAQEYIEMKYGANAPHVYHAEAPSGLRLLGFAVTGSKKIYGHFSLTGHHGLYYLSFDQTANKVKWLPVDGTVGVYTKPGVITGLWGSDGDKLLVNRAEDRAGVAALHWATPLDQ